MKKVRQIRVIKQLGEMTEEGQIFTEYALTPHHFYPEGREDLIEQVGLDIRLAETKEIFEMYFEELPGVPFDETREYPQVKQFIGQRKEELEVQIFESQIELDYLTTLIDED